MNLTNLIQTKIQHVIGFIVVILSLLGIILGTQGTSSQSDASNNPATTASATSVTPTPKPISTEVPSTEPTTPSPEPTTPTTKPTTPTPTTPTTKSTTKSTTPTTPTTKSTTPTLPTIEDRESIVIEALSRRGNVIGTDGKPAIALRFDHHLDSFGEKVLPLLDKYDLPWGQMLNAQRINNPSFDDNWTWDQLADTTHQNGGEIWNHGLTHESFSTASKADSEITDGLALLRENLPSLVIDGYAPAGQPEMMGFEGQDRPEKFYETYPGRLVLNQHAFIRGYYPEVFAPLNGPNLVGQAHITLDRQKNGRIQQYVRRVLNTRNGVTFMLHPNYLDKKGYITTNELDSVLAYIAHLRDSGQIEILSPTGILMADANVDSKRGNLYKGETTGQFRERTLLTIPLDRTSGVPHELSAQFSGQGQATIHISVESPTKAIKITKRVALKPAFTGAHIPVTPPTDATSVTIEIDGTGSYSDLVFRPI